MSSIKSQTRKKYKADLKCEENVLLKIYNMGGGKTVAISNCLTDGERDAVRRLCSKGALKVKYADNIPWFATVTEKGYGMVDAATAPFYKKAAASVASWLSFVKGLVLG